MKCGYRGWIIDATPDFSLGKFFAHARLVRISPDDDVDSERLCRSKVNGSSSSDMRRIAYETSE
ncbi:hypothetical protein OKW42_004703 [Paraburkholderia sp. WC7.3d]|uniref:Uncharacterized protein n=1 Tax=Paraburkholderia podalyriae TaxID=1938811 RepID=A0ABR7Q3B9_9BURK|nr:hypothetical protein [Paraburkholderia podalyriae]